MIELSSPIDFLIVGGGPAGSAAAVALAQQGCRVLVVEQSDYGTVRIGETIPAAAKTVLARLGMKTESASDGLLPCPGTVSVWGSDTPQINDSLFDPDGDGAHLDRPNFDAALVRQAEAAGASVVTCATVRSCRRDGARWDVTVVVTGESHRLQALTLIDGAGRQPWPGRPSRRKSFDRQVAMVSIFNLQRGRHAQCDHRTWIEATPRGWWYSSALPGDRLVAAHFTDSDLLDVRRNRFGECWAERLSEAPWTGDRLRSATTLVGPQIVPASSTISLPISAPGYIAVGDAASTIDPLSSHGILYALTSGLAAAEALISPDPVQAIAQYSQMIAERFCDDLRTRMQFCRAERRWPDSVFWRRRSGITPAFAAAMRPLSLTATG